MGKKYVVPIDEAKVGVLIGNTGSFRVLIDEEDTGARNFSLLVNTMKAGLKGRAHKHADSEHGWYILSGYGTLFVEDQPYRLEPGAAAFVPTNVMHQLEVDSDEDLTYVVVYSPPGPEKELLKKGEQAFDQ